MAISIDWGTKVIFVPKSDTTLIQSSPSEIRQLDLNTFRLAIKELESGDVGVLYLPTHNHYTTISVGGVTLARVIEIINGYSVTFEDGTYAVNLVGANSNVGDKVNVNQVSVRSSNSAGLIQQAELESLKYQVESMRTSHQGFGNSFYVSTAGSDNNSGTASTSPKRTIAAALAMCESGRGDIIYLLAPGSGVGTFAENILLNKEDVHLRGPGRGVSIQPTSGVPISVSADNCSVIGMKVLSAVGSSDDCMVVDGRFVKLDGLYIVGADIGGATPVGTGNGIHFRGGDYSRVEDCVIEKCGGNGVLLTDIGLANGAPREVYFNDNLIYYNRGCGIKFTGASANSTRLNWLENNAITHNSQYGVWIGENTQRTVVRASNYIKDNATYPTGDVDPTRELYLAVGVDAMIDNMADTMPTTISSAVWANATGAEVAIRMAEAWGRLGLDPSKPLNTGQTSITFGQIVMALTGDATNTTVTRQ